MESVKLTAITGIARQGSLSLPLHQGLILLTTMMRGRMTVPANVRLMVIIGTALLVWRNLQTHLRDLVLLMAVMAAATVTRAMGIRANVKLMAIIGTAHLELRSRRTPLQSTIPLLSPTHQVMVTTMTTAASAKLTVITGIAHLEFRSQRIHRQLQSLLLEVTEAVTEAVKANAKPMVIIGIALTV